MKRVRLRIVSALMCMLFVLTAFPLSAFASSATGGSWVEYWDNDGNYIIALDPTPDDDFATLFNEAVDVTRYGTVPGTTAENGEVNFKIIVPEGTYDVYSQLRLYSNTTLVMNGVTLKRKDQFVMLRLGRKVEEWDDYNNGKGRPGYTGFKNMAIIGGTYDGCGQDDAFMRFGHSSNITIKDATFTNAKNSHYLEIGGCQNVNIENCKFLNFVGNWGDSQNYEAVQFDVLAGNHFAAYHPENDETVCRNVTVRGCTFKNLQRGVGTHTGIVNGYCTNMVFENNTFENITGYAIIATNYANSKINNNTIKNCGAGIYFRTMEANHSNFYASKYHSNARKSAYKLNSQILNNNLTITTGYKVNYRNVGYGIQLLGENLAKKAGNVTAGDFRTCGVTVQNNTISLNCTGYGIWMDGTYGNKINKNTITCKIAKKGKGGTGDGIRLIKSRKNTVSNNTIKNIAAKYDSGMNGISLITSSGANTVSSNKINNTKKDGVHIEKSASNKIASNKIAGSKRDGIHLEKSDSNNLTGNTISKITRNGIGIYNSKKLAVTNNKISNCKKYGIFTNVVKKGIIKKFSKNKVAKCKKVKNW